MAVGAVVDVRARTADLIFRDAEALHVRQVRTERLVDRVRELFAQKPDLLEIVGLLDNGRKDLHIVLEVEIVLQHVVAEFFRRQRAVRHLRYERVGEIARPDVLHARMEPLRELAVVMLAHLCAMIAT